MATAGMILVTEPALDFNRPELLVLDLINPQSLPGEAQEPTMRMSDLKPGWAVVTNDGHRLGTVREVGQNYLLVSTSSRGGDLYVPSSAIGNVDRSVVLLNVDARDAHELGWEQPPRSEDEPTGAESDLHRHI